MDVIFLLQVKKSRIFAETKISVFFENILSCLHINIFRYPEDQS